MTDTDAIRPAADVTTHVTEGEAADARALRLGALPEAPLAMPTQVLERPTGRRTLLRGLFAGAAGHRAGT